MHVLVGLYAAVLLAGLPMVGELLFRTSVLVDVGRCWSPLDGAVTARTAQRRPRNDLQATATRSAGEAYRRAGFALPGRSRLRGLRPAGPPPTASPEPVRVQRRVSETGVVMVARQPVALGRVHAGKTVAIDVTDTELVIGCDDGPRTVRRANTLPIRNLKANRPRKAGP